MILQSKWDEAVYRRLLRVDLQRLGVKDASRGIRRRNVHLEDVGAIFAQTEVCWGQSIKPGGHHEARSLNNHGFLVALRQIYYIKLRCCIKSKISP